MKNFLIITATILAASILGANVIAKVDYPKVELGEMVTYSLEISGEDIERPHIKKLCGVDVISTSSQTNMQIINNSVSRSYMLSYKFVPQKSCRIEPVEVQIEGKTQTSNAVDVEVVPVSGAKDQNFVLELQSSKNELFVGESFEVKLTFRQKSTAEAIDSEFTPPQFNGFWVKEESKPQRTQDGGYITTTIIYRLAPQREGTLGITKATMRIASRGNKESSWGDWIPTIKWKTYFSNELSFDVKPIPADAVLVGGFGMEVDVQKREVDANEALNVTIHVKGEGNFEDIKSFKPDIDSVAVYDEKIEIKGNELTQKLAFVSDKSFTIPAFSLKYFDPKAKELKSISTEPVFIKVKGEKASQELNIKKESSKRDGEPAQPASGDGLIMAVIAFFAGIAAGVLAMMIKSDMSKKKREPKSIKDKRVLLVKLLPYRDDGEVREIIEDLEREIYTGEGQKTDVKTLKAVLKKYDIS